MHAIIIGILIGIVGPALLTFLFHSDKPLNSWPKPAWDTPEQRAYDTQKNKERDARLAAYYARIYSDD